MLTSAIGSTVSSKLGRFLLMPLMAFTLVFGVAQTASPSTAEAGVKSKVFKKGLKGAGKVFRKMEKAGRRAQRKGGLVGKAGKAMSKFGRAGRKGTQGIRKGMRKFKRGKNKLIGRTKVGRVVQKGFRKAKRFQKEKIDRAFRKCKSKACAVWQARREDSRAAISSHALRTR